MQTESTESTESAPTSPAPLTKADLDNVLYGVHPAQRIVAVETDTRAVPPTATLFVRPKDSEDTVLETMPFYPWLIMRDPRPLPDVHATVVLEGTNGYKHLTYFASWRAFQEGRRILRDERRDYLDYGSAIKNFLIGEGVTLFKGMAFPDVRRMQIDIETSDLSPVAPDACIFMIVASDNRGHEDVLVGDEREMLVRLGELIQEWNPDVIEGHNLIAFDLPWIRTRAKAHKVPLTWGRDHSEMGIGNERNCAIGANTRPFVPHYIWGRHVVDTLLAAQRFDVARGEIGSYGLKECAVTYHIAEPDRVYLDRSVILDTWKTDPDLVRRYALADVRETRRLAEVVCPTEFYQTQMVGDSYQNVCVTGSGEKINSIFVRAYLARQQAVARQSAPVPYGGGYTEMRVSGVLQNIVKADVESLYPSIMLTNRITSSTDTLGLFLPLLDELKKRRIIGKKLAKKYDDESNIKGASYWDGLQNSYKLLINSFYGYLGAPFYFNDYVAAAKVTEIGQEIVKQIAAELETRGATVIEIDTDGVYFQMPEGAEPNTDEAFVEAVGTTMPEGIRLAFDGRYAVMLSLKAKNYVLVGYDGKKVFKGSSLRSRADEKFGRSFLNAAVDLLLADKKEDLAHCYAELFAKIENRELGIEQIARRERVTENTFKSEARKRNAEAMKGLQVGDYAVLYQREDKSLALAADYDNDEDIEYYQTKLYKFAQRLEAAIGDDFERFFPKPLTGAKRKAHEDGKQQMSLFDM
ncbi:MAG: DNA polymerase [Armatimonadetes bacterium]|nr:DNA polymerase [Armatimonadota bacterium]